ncbi:MAG TPA: hypothetical protein VMH27_11550 [Puia sp.]|nr:hypothetical protein [Puia sp.]
MKEIILLLFVVLGGWVTKANAQTEALDTVKVILGVQVDTSKILKDVHAWGICTTEEGTDEVTRERVVKYHWRKFLAEDKVTRFVGKIKRITVDEIKSMP